MHRSRVKYWLFGLVALHGVYAAAFIARTSFVVEGRRYFCLLDDAMITLCYATNLANGHGLVWYPGADRVEGYTSPLWTFLLAGVAGLGLSKITTCLVVQCLGVPIVWLTAIGAAWLARCCRLSSPVAIVSAIWVLAYYNLNYFTLLGMETGLAAVVLTFGMAASFQRLHVGAGSVWSMWWVGPAILLRPEAAAFVVFAVATQLLFLKKKRWRCVAGFLIGAALVAGYVIFRKVYFGAWVPNTYVLKLTGWPVADRLVVGLRQAPWTMASLGAFVLLAAAGVRRVMSPRTLLLVALPILAMLYQLYVGGDHRPLDRFVVPLTPLLFVGAARGLERVIRGIRNLGWARRRGRYRLVGVCVLVVALNSVTLSHALLLEAPQTVMDGNMRNVQSSCVINRLADRDVVVAVGWAGAIPYFTERACVDIYGRCDPIIAKLPAHRGVRAGHNKFDREWTLRHYEPDLVDAAALLWYRMPEVQNHYLLNHYLVDGQRVPMLVRKRSDHMQAGEVFPWYEVRRAFDIP